MTERLSHLLHDEADLLDIPSAPTGPVLAKGRSIRRRRRATRLVAAAAVLGVIGGGAALMADGPGGGDRTSDAPVSATERYLRGGAYAVGSTVYFGDPGNGPITLEEKVKALYYTSEGVVVRTGRTPWTDDPGPSHYALVTPNGDVQRLDLDLGDRVPATDPHTQTMVYADGQQGAWELVVVDISTNTEVKRIPFEGSFSWGGWEAPPVGLAGDTAYVGMDDATLSIDLETGESSVAEGLDKATMPEATGGHALTTDYSTGMEVVDLASGERLLQIDLPEGHHFGELSPDGRYLKVVAEEELDENGQMGPTDPGFDVYDVATGEHVSFDQQPWDFGWSPDGHLVKVTRTEVTVCDAGTGTCTTDEQASGKGEIKIAGNAYES
ncbi:YncE family protein [Nocardioides jensenii]|uniref:YncE family protein n=1 Tax=Nocardioides jensenii TaxID=1843 RepID=UPI000830FD39|nr:hypothetical protein [Nocardioides jensenii]